MNGQRAFAYYSTGGELMGVARYISSLQLPLGLLSNLKNNYSNYWISDLFELSNNDGTHYYVTLEKAMLRWCSNQQTEPAGRFTTKRRKYNYKPAR